MSKKLSNKYIIDIIDGEEVISMRCFRCREYLHLDNFHNDKNARKKKSGIAKASACKDCSKELKSIYNDKVRGPNLDLHLTQILRAAKGRVKDFKFHKRFTELELNIDKDYLKMLFYNQKGKCAFSGIDMTYIIKGKRQPYNISIDRIDNSKGYIKGNVHLVCAYINVMRRELSVEDFLNICKKVTEHHEKKN